MVNETGSSSAKFLRDAAKKKGVQDARNRELAERGRTRAGQLESSNDVQQLSSALVRSQARASEPNPPNCLASLQLCRMFPKAMQDAFDRELAERGCAHAGQRGAATTCSSCHSPR